MYVSSLLSDQVRVFARVMRMLQARFSLERVPMPTASQLYRITERAR